MRIGIKRYLIIGALFCLNSYSATLEFKVKNSDQTFACYKATLEGRRDVFKKCKETSVDMDSLNISECSYEKEVAKVVFTYSCTK